MYFKGTKKLKLYKIVPLNPEELELKIESMLGKEDKYYLFIDEVQNVFGFESVVQAYAEEGYSIFITGSNSYLLSDEISTKLTDRYLNFETFTLDFSEYLDMKSFFKKDINQDLYLEFEEYVVKGRRLEMFRYMKEFRLFFSIIIQPLFH